jgi:hypothetical protein
MLIRREMPVPDPSGSGSRWSLDLLLTDQDGMPTFVECKRYADTRARREVVGQMLEYAANGHYYWDHGEIRGFVEETARELGHSADRLFAELRSEQFGDLDGLIETFIEHLRQGTVRLVFFMEQAPQELKSIVDFLNSQTERTEVLIVEARQFDVEGRRFVVPTLFGYSEEARRAKQSAPTSSGAKRRTWTQDEFFAELDGSFGPEELDFYRSLLELGQELELQVRWGTGVTKGSLNLVAPDLSGRSFVTFDTNGAMTLNVGWLNESPEAEEFRRSLERGARETVGLAPRHPDDSGWTPARARTGDREEDAEPEAPGLQYWMFELAEWFPKRGGLTELFRTAIDSVRTHPPRDT